MAGQCHMRAIALQVDSVLCWVNAGDGHVVLGSHVSSRKRITFLSTLTEELERGIRMTIVNLAFKILETDVVYVPCGTRG